jgi:RimJ/RimL family protein N-acetyltransferase
MTSLKTERLLLRPLTLEDAARASTLSCDWEVARMTVSMPFPQPAINVEGQFLIEQARRPLARDHLFAVELPGEGLIGVSGAHVRGGDPIGQKVEIGYWLGRPYWGRGYATEAAAALADFAGDLGHGPVTANHFVDNPASGRVLQKAGFAYTGHREMKFSLARGEAVLSLGMAREANAQVKAA